MATPAPDTGSRTGSPGISVEASPGTRVECVPVLDVADPSDATSLLGAAWRRWGESMVDHLVGDYAFVIRDRQAAVTFAARDPLGSRPLFYRIDRGRFVHAASIAELRRATPLPFTPDLDWVVHRLVGLTWDYPGTAYVEARRLPPGHCLALDAAGEVREWRHHVWRDDAPPARRRDGRWVEAYRERLEEAIRCRTDGDGPIGAENSGGLDSASVAAFLARALGDSVERLHSFAFVMDEMEPAAALATGLAWGIVRHHVFTRRPVPPDLDALAAQGVAALGHPVEHFDAVGHVPFYEVCRAAGIRTLFSGFGGDEIVTNRGQLVRAEIIARRDGRALFDVMPGNAVTRALRTAKALALGGARRRPSALQEALGPRWERMLLRPEVARRTGADRKFCDWDIRTARFRTLNAHILGMHLEPAYLLMHRRLENCAVMARAYGVDYRWPLLDHRLVQQYLSTPAIEKLGPRGLGRFLHRRAVAGIVPDSITWRPRKDMGAKVPRIRAPTGKLEFLARGLRRHAEHLHPALEEIVDRGKLRDQLAIAERGAPPPGFEPDFRLNVDAIVALNLWLHDGVVPG